MDNLFTVDIHEVVKRCEADYYDFIIVGSGMGGGIVARTILDPEPSADKTPPFYPRVLLIEKGSLLFSTNVLNTPSPRWNPDDLNGPSMDNALVYNIVRRPVTITSESLPYAGGPVHCLGGRSNLWGLYTPRMDEEDVKDYFPQEVLDYLFHKPNGGTKGTGYSRAYKLLCGDSGASISRPYPDDGSIMHVDTINRANLIRNNLGEIDLGSEISIGPFDYCPMAAEFTHRKPHDTMYHMSMGGFSTVHWILDRVYNKDRHLDVLTTSQVVAVESATKSDTEGGFHNQKVVGLIISGDFNNNITIPVKKPQVILSAGTIDTARIALRSGLDIKLPYVGVGLTDHEIWGTRLRYVVPKDGLRQALRLQSWVSLYSADPGPASLDTSRRSESRCLLNVTINAQSFLGRADEKFLPTRYIDEDGKTIDRRKFREIEKEKSMIQVVFIFGAELNDESRVLNEPVPTIHIRPPKSNNSRFKEQMRVLADNILQQLRRPLGVPFCDANLPEISTADFGVVAHEVGTMRMGTVVDKNLKVIKWDNLHVCDLSVFPVSPSANPSLTLAALAQRLGKHLVGEIKPTS